MCEDAGGRGTHGMRPPDPSRNFFPEYWTALQSGINTSRRQLGQACVLLLAKTPLVLGAGGLESWREQSPGLRGPGHHLEDLGVQRFLSPGNQLHSCPISISH